MATWHDRARSLLEYAGGIAAETLWPTRCAVCDTPGAVLCRDCAFKLAWLDHWRACKRCGAPFGLVQCDACNPEALARLGRKDFPFAGCTSAVIFDERAGSIVRVCKDLGEQRLAKTMALYMARALPPSWRLDSLAFIPASRKSYTRRGFDHAELIATELGAMIGMRPSSLLERPRTKDQRKLSGKARIANLEENFQAKPGISPGAGLLLVDDVFTTGATLCAASDALKAAGAQEIYCLTFARV